MKISKEEFKSFSKGLVLDYKTKWPWKLVEMVLFALILAFDLCMKDYLYKFLSAKPTMHFVAIKGFLDLHYTQNTGAGFGILSDSTVGLIVVTILVITAVILYLNLNHKESEWLRIPLVMIVAGGVGNLVDRLALGYVRDFFEFTFMEFAIFNIADAFVTVGAILLVIYLIIMMFQEAKGSKKKLDEMKEKAENEQEKQANENILDAKKEQNVVNSKNFQTKSFEIEKVCADKVEFDIEEVKDEKIEK